MVQRGTFTTAAIFVCHFTTCCIAAAHPATRVPSRDVLVQDTVSWLQSDANLYKVKTRAQPKATAHAELRRQNQTVAYVSSENSTHLLLRGPVVGGDVSAQVSPVVGLKPAPGQQGFAFELRIPKLKCYARSMKKWEGTREHMPFTPEWLQDQKDCLKLAGVQLMLGWQFRHGEWIYIPVESFRGRTEVGIGGYIPFKDFGPGVGIGSYQSGYTGPLYRFYTGLFHQWALEVAGNLCNNHPGDKAAHMTLEPAFRHTMTWTPGYQGGPRTGFDGHRLQGFGTVTFDPKGTGPHKMFGEVRWDHDPKDEGKVTGIGGELRRNIWFGPTVPPCPSQRDMRKAGDYEVELPDKPTIAAKLPKLTEPSVSVKLPPAVKVEVPKGLVDIIQHLPPTGPAPQPQLDYMSQRFKDLQDYLRPKIEHGVDLADRWLKKGVNKYNEAATRTNVVADELQHGNVDVTDEIRDPYLDADANGIPDVEENGNELDLKPVIKTIAATDVDQDDSDLDEDEKPDKLEDRLPASRPETDPDVLDIGNQHLPAPQKLDVHFAPPKILHQQQQKLQEVPDDLRMDRHGFYYNPQQFKDIFGDQSEEEWAKAGGRNMQVQEFMMKYGAEHGRDKFSKAFVASRKGKTLDCLELHTSCNSPGWTQKYNCKGLCVCVTAADGDGAAASLAQADSRFVGGQPDCRQTAS